MKKAALFLALSCLPAFAQTIIQSDAQSRVDRVNRNLPQLEQGDAGALIRVSAVLQANIPAVIDELRQSPQHADGRAIALWAKGVWAQESLLPIARVAAQLALGADLQTPAAEHFCAGENAAHARALGYYLGALQGALEAVEPDAARRAARLDAFAKDAAAYVGVADLHAAPPAEPSAKQRWAYTFLTRAWQAESPLLHLAIPPGHADDAACQTALAALRDAWAATRGTLRTP